MSGKWSLHSSVRVRGHCSFNWHTALCQQCLGRPNEGSTRVFATIAALWPRPPHGNLARRSIGYLGGPIGDIRTFTMRFIGWDPRTPSPSRSGLISLPYAMLVTDIPTNSTPTPRHSRNTPRTFNHTGQNTSNTRPLWERLVLLNQSKISVTLGPFSVPPVLTISTNLSYSDPRVQGPEDLLCRHLIRLVRVWEGA